MHSNAQLDLAQEMLVGVLLSLAHASRLPARPWPLAAACEELGKNGAVVDPLLICEARRASAVDGEALLEKWLATLVTRGSARVSGTGVTAHWRLSSRWQRDWLLIADALSADERAAWERSAQALARCASMWEKTAAAAASGSAPSRSEHPPTRRHPLV